MINKERPFGIEIEAVGLNHNEVVNALRDARVDSYQGDYGATPEDGRWKVKSDGSLSYSEYGKTFEITSPILFGEEGLSQVKVVCDAINTRGAKVNRTCGLHVHHYAEDLHPQHLMSLLGLYHNAEVAIDKLLPPSRRYGQSQYSQSLERLSWNGVDIKKFFTLRDIEHKVGQGQRYWHVNPQALMKFGTVEFRQHQGTTCGNKISNWVRFTQELIETGRRCFFNKMSRNSIDFNSLMDMLYLENKDKAYLQKRMDKLNVVYNTNGIPSEFYIDYTFDNPRFYAMRVTLENPEESIPPVYRNESNFLVANNRMVWKVMMTPRSKKVASISVVSRGGNIVSSFNVHSKMGQIQVSNRNVLPKVVTDALAVLLTPVDDAAEELT